MVGDVVYLGILPSEESPYMTLLIDAETGAFISEISGVAEVFGDTVCIDTDQNASCIDAEGRELWSVRGVLVTSDRPGDNKGSGTLVAVIIDDTVVGFDATTGAERWTSSFPPDIDYAWYLDGALAIRDATSLVLVDAETGSERGGIPLSEDWVVSATDGVDLYIFREKEAICLSGVDLATKWSAPHGGPPDALFFAVGDGVVLATYGSIIRLATA